MLVFDDPINRSSTTERLKTLVEVNQMLMRAIDPDELLTVLLECVNRIFLASACSVGLVEPLRPEIVFTKAVGGAEVTRFRLQKGQGIAGWVAEHGAGVICKDVSKDSRFYPGVDEKTGFKTESILCAPIELRGQVVGVIETMNTAERGGFTDHDFELLMAFAGLAATAIERVKNFASLQNANALCREEEDKRYELVVGTSAPIQRALDLLRTAAKTNSTVLLLGESGTGKEVMARALHHWSPRAVGPFVTVNGASLTAELLASDLFGHERGAFTGAVARRKGKFELATRGTIFLDEIGELPMNLQARLLRVLQDREIQRVGGTDVIQVDVRIVAATNRDLSRAVEEGGFRQDLFYRLNVVAVELPPLRDRPSDIPVLLDHMLERFCTAVKRETMGLDGDARRLLEGYHWPGNVRELQNVIERCVVLSPGPSIQVQDLPSEIRGEPVNRVLAQEQVPEDLPLREAVEAFKRVRIQAALRKASGNQREAARSLGLAQSNLSRLIKQLGVHAPRLVDHA